MRRAVSVFVLAGLLIMGSGCVMVIGTGHARCKEQVVVVDGEFHVVNTRTHKIRKIEVQPEEDVTTATIEESNGG